MAGVHPDSRNEGRVRGWRGAPRSLRTTAAGTMDCSAAAFDPRSESQRVHPRMIPSNRPRGWLCGQQKNPEEMRQLQMNRALRPGSKVKIPGYSMGPPMQRMACWLSVLFALLPLRQAIAVDGLVDVRNTVQEGRAGADSYWQRSTTSQFTGQQTVRLLDRASLRFDGNYLREGFRSRFGLTRSDFDRRTGNAGINFDLNGKLGRLMLGAETFDQRTEGAATDNPTLMRDQLNGSAQVRRGWFDLAGHGSVISSRRDAESTALLKEEERIGTVSTRTRIPRVGEFRYGLSALADRNRSSHQRTDQVTHTLSYSGSTRFAGERGFLATKETSSFFTQTQTHRDEDGWMRLVVPDIGGYLLDDTPELHDPLEADLTSVPELYDGDRQAATSVQIGDTAPAVREFGGDYRNIGFDFSEAVEVDSLVIYIDRTIVVPAMFQWRVFASNDPEGRIWQELSSAQAVYQEWGVGRQGWTIRLNQPDPLAVRFIKVVDAKLGPTVPELSVTEMEAYAPDAVDRRDESKTVNHRLGVTLTYRIVRELRASYDLAYRHRSMDGATAPYESQGHGFGMGWSRGAWALSGRHEMRWADGERRRETDVSTQNLTLRRGRMDSFVSTLSWSRTQDRSNTNDKVSQSLSAGYTWPAAPALRIDQRVTTSRLTDRAADLTSTSLTVTTSATGSPIPSINMDLQQSERWVSREAGTGFSRYSDTSLTVGWRPVPLIAFQSAIRYQLRDEGDWLIQNMATWEPLSEGTLRLGLSANHLRDTRASETQGSGGIRLEWDARTSLTLQGEVQAVGLRREGRRDSPLNTDLRGIWRF